MKYLILLFLTGCTVKPTLNNGFNHNVYGESIIQCSLPLEINTNSLDAKTKESVVYAINEWNTKFNKTLFVLSESSKNTVNNTLAWEYSNRQQAMTSARWSGTCIYSVNISVNMRDFYYYRTGERQSGYNMDALILHELGHTLGLVDNDNSSSVMYRYLAIQENRVKTTEYDVNNLKSVYK
jgi:predicted Zn-dependent protease